MFFPAPPESRRFGAHACTMHIALNEGDGKGVDLISKRVYVVEATRDVEMEDGEFDMRIVWERDDRPGAESVSSEVPARLCRTRSEQ